MITKNVVKVTNKGMVTIPAHIRKKYGIVDGKRVMFIEDEGQIRIIPILTKEEIKKMASYTSKEMLDLMKEDKDIELELEEK
ncbi:MAG: AbrB/MazE/SpoVT family DNA-binding domain-containing protein [Promethearchaeota archaeon]